MAATTSKEYWECRSAERMIDYTAEAEKTANKIGKAYLNAGKYLSDEAGKVVKSFGKAFDLSEAEALRLLKNPPGKSMVQQLKAAVSGVSDPDKRKELEKMISSPAYAYRIGRLEDVEKNIRNSCAKLYNTELKADESFFRSLPMMAYERTIFDVQKAMGISSSFAQFPESRINRILSTKWSGEHFSTRVWGNTNALANDLKHDMLVGIMAGKSEVHMADDIMARMGGGAYAARRVVRTETNYIANQAELDGYKECGLEKYEFSAHLDSRTSEICAEMDGKVFALKDAQAGTNLPPMHPFCRSSTIPVLPSEEELDRIIQQDGDAIGADVDFEEWKSHLVENEDGKLVYRVDNSAESGIIKSELEHRSISEQFNSNIAENTDVGLTKLSANGEIVDPMDKKLYDRIKSNLENNGCSVISAQKGSDEERLLQYMGAEAMSDAHGIIHLGDVPSASALFEEIIHFTQIKKYGDLKSTDFVERAAREIAANRKLLKNSKAYHFTANDVADIQRNLSVWENEFLERTGLTYEKSKYNRDV